MTRVDPLDDTILRYVVWHYRFDVLRNERRNVVVCAVDSADELKVYLDEHTDDLRARKAQGLVDPREQFPGVVLEPGHRSGQGTRGDERGTATFEAGQQVQDGE